MLLNKISRSRQVLGMRKELLANQRAKLATLKPDDKIKDAKKRKAKYDKSKEVLQNSIAISERHLAENEAALQKLIDRKSQVDAEEKEAHDKLKAWEAKYLDDHGEIVIPEDEIPTVDAAETEERQKLQRQYESVKKAPAEKPAPKPSESYYAYMAARKTFEIVEGAKPIEFKGFEKFDFYISKWASGWRIAEARTGMQVGGANTKKDAIASVETLLAQRGDKLQEMIDDSVEKRGLSPQIAGDDRRLR
jgi:chromosome segregation ATPase